MPDEVIVDVAEAERHLGADVDEVAPRQPARSTSRCGVTIAAQRGDVALLVEDLADERRSRRRRRSLFSSSSSRSSSFVHLRPVVIDHRVDDAVEAARPALRRGSSGSACTCSRSSAIDARVAVVHGDEVVRAEEEVDVVRREAVLAGLEVDAVQDDVEIAVVGLDLRDTARADIASSTDSGWNANVSLRISDSGIDGAARSTQTIDARRRIRARRDRCWSTCSVWPLRWTKMVIMSDG